MTKVIASQKFESDVYLASFPGPAQLSVACSLFTHWKSLGTRQCYISCKQLIVNIFQLTIFTNLTCRLQYTTENESNLRSSKDFNLVFQSSGHAAAFTNRAIEALVLVGARDGKWYYLIIGTV